MSSFHKLTTVAASTIVAINSVGCSFAFVNAAPDHAAQAPAQQPVECTSGRAAPVIDTIIGAYQLVRTGYALQADDSDYSGTGFTREADIGLGLGFMTLFTASAIYGYSLTSECAGLKERHALAASESWSPPAPTESGATPTESPSRSSIFAPPSTEEEPAEPESTDSEEADAPSDSEPLELGDEPANDTPTTEADTDTAAPRKSFDDTGEPPAPGSASESWGAPPDAR